MTDDTHAHPEIVTAIAERSLADVCETCSVEARWIEELVAHGVIAPAGSAPDGWTFAEVSVLRIAKAKRLEADFDLNVPGLALVLDLLDEIETLRRRVRVLSPAAGRDPSPGA